MSTSAKNNPKWEVDAVDNLILNKGVRIQRLYFDRSMDLMLVVLNNRHVLQRRLSEYPSLEKASEKELQNYRSTRTGIHWDDLDEDISLRGLLKEEVLRNIEREAFSA